MNAKDMQGMAAKGCAASAETSNAWQEAVEEIASYLSVGVEGCTPEESVARIKEAATDMARVQMERAERAEDALKKARGQEPCAFWWIGPDGKDNGGPYRGKPSDVAIDSARNSGCEPVLLYIRPVPTPAVAAPAVPDATCKERLQVGSEWLEVLSGLVAIADAKGKRQGSPNHCHSRPGIWDGDNIRNGLAGKPCAECAIYDRARDLLQSTGEKK